MTAADRNASSTLILAPRGRDAPAAAALLREAGTQAIVCTDMAHFSRSLRDDVGCAVVTEEALRDADLTALTAWVAKQPTWSDFPFIVLTERGDASPGSRAPLRSSRRWATSCFSSVHFGRRHSLAWWRTRSEAAIGNTKHVRAWRNCTRARRVCGPR